MHLSRIEHSRVEKPTAQNTFFPSGEYNMSEKLQALEQNARAQANAHEAEPVVDMRSARLPHCAPGDTDSAHLPPAKVTANHLEIGDIDHLSVDSHQALDTGNDEALDIKGLLTHLLTFPRTKDGIVPDSWGTDKRSEIKRISTDMDSVYTLDTRVRGVIDTIRQDIIESRTTLRT